jgi:hypothetical protein
MKQLIIILTVFVVFIHNAFSQKITVYDSYVPSQKETEKPKLRNFFAINPLGLFVGDYPLYYERNIAGPFNIMVSGGVTSKNSLYDIMQNGDLFGVNSNYDNNFNRSADMGYSYMIQPKIYLRERYFNGIYLGMEYRFRHYNYESTTYDDPNYGTVSVGNVKEYREVADIKFNCGWAYNMGSGVTIDFYVGVGTRTNRYHYAEYNTVNNNGSGTIFINPTQPTSSNSYQIDYATLTKGTVTLGTGFRIGYAF